MPKQPKKLEFGYSLHPVFCTPLFSASITGEELSRVQAEVARAVNQIREKEDLKSPWKYDTIAGTSFKYTTPEKASENSNIKKYKMKLLEQFITDAMHQYCAMLKYSGYTLNIFESWINIHKKGHYMNTHIHTTSDISGVYYHKTSGESGNIQFITPNLVTEHGGFGFANDNAIEVSPYDGFLILFPGWLRHQVRPNTTDEERICVAFNTHIRVSNQN